MQFNFAPLSLPEEAETLRREVRLFLAESLADTSDEDRTATWDGFDPAFSRIVGVRGWIGMTLSLIHI